MSKYRGKFIPKNIEKYKGDYKNIFYRSLIEYRYMKFFDENSSIIEWSSEELYVYYNNPFENKGKKRRYFPDFIIKVKKKDGSIHTIMVEVKCFSDSKPPPEINLLNVKNAKRRRRFVKETIKYKINMAKWNAAKLFCEQNNWEFKVLTDKNLPKVNN